MPYSTMPRPPSRSDETRGKRPLRSERTVLSRRQFAVLGTATVVATAGCSDIFDDDPDEVIQADLAGVPADVDGVLFADEQLVTDERTVAVIDGIVDAGTGLDGDESMAAYTDVAIEVGTSDVAYQDSTFFYREAETERYQAIVVRTDEDAAGVVEWAEDRFGPLEETTHEGIDVSVSADGDETVWIATLDAATAIVGTEHAVADGIAVEQADGAGLSGQLERAYHQAGDGHMKATLLLEDDELETVVGQINPSLGDGFAFLPDPEVLTATYRTGEFDGDEDDDGLPFNGLPFDEEEDEETDTEGPTDSDEEPEATFVMQLTMSESEQAEQIHETIELVLDGEDLPVGGDIEDDELLSRLVVERTDEHVTIGFTTTPDELASFFNGST